jgi:phosphoribosylformylglycinamidine synthase PurS subunit
MLTATIRVELKDGVLDPQGVTIKNSLIDMGYSQVGAVRSGKIFRIDIDTDNVETARELIDEMCRKLLANPVIEQYTVVDLE